jgi:enamine deaminase RidA (YjgF/YER057c/UK114 family)
MFNTTIGANSIGRVTLNTDVEVERNWNLSRAIVDGRWVFLSAVSGMNYATMVMPDDVVDQARQAVENVRFILSRLDVSMDEVVRYNLIVPDWRDVSKLRGVMSEAFAGALPVHGVLCCNLPRPEIKVEIEVTALRKE